MEFLKCEVVVGLEPGVARFLGREHNTTTADQHKDTHVDMFMVNLTAEYHA